MDESKIKNLKFIVTGQGRSGTKWLAKLINTDDSISCYHEKFGRFDSKKYQKEPKQDDSYKYLKEREKLMLEIDGRPWAEVNSYLRYIPATIKHYWDVPVYGIVRDGIATVKSMYVRGVFSRPSRPPIKVPDEIENRFAKCCWYWADAYQRLRDDGIQFFKLEGLNDNWIEMKYLNRTLNIHIKQNDWKRFKDRRVNACKQSRNMELSDLQKKIFTQIAGDVQKTFGYKLPDE